MTACRYAPSGLHICAVLRIFLRKVHKYMYYIGYMWIQDKFFQTHLSQNKSARQVDRPAR